jgi:hypothetical protein
VIISATISDEATVLGTLIHELVHVTVGVEHGHKAPFRKAMRAVGLEGKPTATVPGAELLAAIKKWTDGDPYPHKALGKSMTDGKKKQSTRLLKLECPKCGCKVRTTAKWIDEHGPVWPCPCGGELLSA